MSKLPARPTERTPVLKRFKIGAVDRLDRFAVEPSKSILRGLRNTSAPEWAAGALASTAVIGAIAAAPVAGAITAVIVVGAGATLLKKKGDNLRAPSGITDAEFEDLGFPADEVSKIKKGHFKRFGTEASLHSEPEEFDQVHKYLHFRRLDLLDYKKGDFYSIRRMRLKNVGTEPSDSVTYVETSERKCSFKSCEVEAFEEATKAPLLVQSFERPRVKSLRHAFKIFFPTPLMPGDEFELVYKICLPGELDDLSEDDEIMSVYLGRVKQGVDKLDFHVCLNFNPKAVSANCRDDMGNIFPLDGEGPEVSSYTASTWYEELWDIPWSNSSVCRISISVSEPQNQLYVVHYKQ